MEILDHVKLQAVLDGFQKKAFVPMPSGAQPAAGGSAMTEGMAAPMQDPAAAGGAPPVDPATGMPMDPAMAGGAPPVDPATGMPMDPAAGMPMDPAMMGGDPAAMGMDPSMMDPSMMEGMGGGEGTVNMSVPELIQLIETVKGTASGAPAEEGVSPEGEPKPKKKGGTAQLNEKMDTLLAALGAGAPSAPGM